MWVQSLGGEDPLKEGVTTFSSILAWRIPWTEEPGGLQSIGLHRVRQDWSHLTCIQSSCFIFIFFIFFKVIVLIHWFCCCFYRKYHDFQVLHQLRSLIVTALVFAPFLLFFAAGLLIHTLLKRCLENISSDNLITVAYNLISPDHIGL